MLNLWVFFNVCFFRGGTQWMALLTHCCPPTVGHGAMWPEWIPSHSTASSCPPAAGSGRETGMWITPVEENPARLGWEITQLLVNTYKPIVYILLSFLCSSVSHNIEFIFKTNTSSFNHMLTTLDSVGLGVCCWLPSQLLPWQKVEFLCPS